jgi:hypothetical protein
MLRKIYVYEGYATLIGKWIYEVWVGGKIRVIGCASTEAEAYRQAALA